MPTNDDRPAETKRRRPLQLIRDKDVADMAHVSLATVWNWSADRILPEPYRITPGVTRWDREEVDNALLARRSPEPVKVASPTEAAGTTKAAQDASRAAPESAPKRQRTSTPRRRATRQAERAQSPGHPALDTASAPD